MADFVADEVRHVELASRLLVQLGGAAALPFEPEAPEPFEPEPVYEEDLPPRAMRGPMR